MANFFLNFCLDQLSHFLHNAIMFSYVCKQIKTFYANQVVIKLHPDLFSTKTVTFLFTFLG